MKCPRCGNESAVMFSDGCPKCHETNETNRLSKIRASLSRVDGDAPKSPPSPIPLAAKMKPVEMKEERPMSKTNQIRWTPEECQRVAVEVDRLFHGLPFAAKALKEAQACLPPERRKSGIGPNDIKKIRALIPGSKSPRPGGGRRAKALAKVSRRASRAPAAPAAPQPALLQPITDTLPAAESLSDLIARQLVGAVIGVGISALEKAVGRLRSVAT